MNDRPLRDDDPAEDGFPASSPSGWRSAWLTDALAESDAAAARASCASPDAARVAGHFAGYGDGPLLDAAAAHPGIRRLLVELAQVRAELGEGAGVDVGPAARFDAAERAPGAEVSPSVRRRALEAFQSGGRSVVERVSAAHARAGCIVGDPSDVVDAGRRPSSPSAHAAPLRRPRRLRYAIAASILLLPAAGFLALGRRTEAAALAIEGVDRVEAGGAVETDGPRTIAMGEHVASGPGERVALRLVGGARVVLGDRTRLSVGCDAPCDGRCGGAIFDVESGRVSVAASTAVPSPASGSSSPAARDAERVALRVPSAGRVDVLDGAAQLERDASGAVRLFVRADARVRWSPRSGGTQELVGPALVRLDDPSGVAVPGHGGEAGPSSGRDDASVFRDLDFFGGAVRRAGDEIRVGARRWRIREDDELAPVGGASAADAPRASRPPTARGRRSEAGGAPAIRFDLDAGATGRISWPADAPVLAARRLEVRVRVEATQAGELRVRLDGVGGSEAGVTLPPRRVAPSLGAAEGGPRLERIVFDLPPEFATRRAMSDLVLEWTAVGTDASIWFEGAVFLGAGAADRPASSPVSASTPPASAPATGAASPDK